MKKKVDPRILLFLLVSLGLVHGIATLNSLQIGVLILSTLFISATHPDAFIKGAYIIAISSVFLGVFIFGTNFISTGTLFTFSLLMEFVRWISLVSVSIVLFSSMTVLEIMASMSWWRIPINITLAFGVGLRFLPVITSEAQRIFLIQARKGNRFTLSNLMTKGLVNFLSGLISPLFVSVLRKANSLVLSIRMQQIPQRVGRYRFKPLDGNDLTYLIMCAVVIAITILFPNGTFPWKS